MSPAHPAKRTKYDWSLPPSILSLLAEPISAQLLNTLIPITSSPPIAHPPIHLTTLNAFTNAFRGNADAQTANAGAAHGSTDSALVDLFYDFTPGTDVKILRAKLEKAFNEDPVATVKIILHARSIHEGKGWREGLWIAAGWLWENHPRTLLANLHLLVDPTCKRDRSKARDQAKKDKKAAEDKGIRTLDEEGEIEDNMNKLPEYPPRPHGTFDDLVDLMVLSINNELNTSYDKLPSVDEALVPSRLAIDFRADRSGQKGGAKRNRSGFVRMGAAAKKLPVDDFKRKILTAGSKTQKHTIMSDRLQREFGSKKFQALYTTVVHIFVNQLRADLGQLDRHKEFLKLPEEKRKPFLGQSSPHLFGLSFAAKWVPTPEKSADRQLHLATAIALLMFPGEGVDLARERLQREVLTPLRAVLKVPETKMVKGSWKIDYTKVPSRAMVKHASSFMVHDKEGFESYLDKVASGRYTISAASLMPHEILANATAPDGKDLLKKRMADLQWKSLVDSIRSSSNSGLDSCLAVADVSGSMFSCSAMYQNKNHPAPITVCLALTLLLTELATATWTGMFFTFSENPTAEFLDPSLPLSERVNTLRNAHWGMSTNFYKIFDLILTTAKSQYLTQDQMVKKLFVFSDMMFDAANNKNQGETEYQTIKRKYQKAGYELPEIVFWNLASGASNGSKPVKADQEGVSLLSGYSGAMMKYFLRQSDEEVDDELAEEMEMDWEAVSHDGKGDEVKESEEQAIKKKEGKKKDDPLTTVMKIINAEPFNGVVIVD